MRPDRAGLQGNVTGSGRTRSNVPGHIVLPEGIWSDFVFFVTHLTGGFRRGSGYAACHGGSSDSEYEMDHGCNCRNFFILCRTICFVGNNCSEHKKQVPKIILQFGFKCRIPWYGFQRGSPWFESERRNWKIKNYLRYIKKIFMVM